MKIEINKNEYFIKTHKENVFTELYYKNDIIYKIIQYTDFSNQKITYEVNSEGIRNGLYISENEFSNIKTLGCFNFKNGVLDGDHKRYYNDELICSSKYKEGKSHGIYIIFDIHNFKIANIGHYYQNQPKGFWLT